MKKFYFLLVSLLVSFAAGAANYSGYYVGLKCEQTGWNFYGNDGSKKIEAQPNSEGIASFNVTNLGEWVMVKVWDGSHNTYYKSTSITKTNEWVAPDTQVDGDEPGNSMQVPSAARTGAIVLKVDVVNKKVMFEVGGAPAPEVITYALHGNFDGEWKDVNLAGEGTVTASNVAVTAAAEFGVKVYTNGSHTGWWAASTEGVNVNATTTLTLVGSDSKNIGIAKGTYDFSYNTTSHALAITKHAEEGGEQGGGEQGEDPQTPDTPKVAATLFVGVGGSWAANDQIKIEVTEDKVKDNCVEFVVTNWVKDSNFKVVVGEAWYGYNGEVENGEWYKTSTDAGNITLPASAEGKDVTITFALDTTDFSASWEAEQGGETPDQPDQPVKEYEVKASFAGWDTVAKTSEVVENVATIVVENWNEGNTTVAEFKIFDEGWCGIDTADEVANNVYNNAGDENVHVPAAANGKTVTIKYATDTHSILVAWEADEPQPEYTVSLMTSINEFTEPLVSTTKLTDNCATLVVENWVVGTQFKFKVNDTWFGHTQEGVVNIESPIAGENWYEGMQEGGMGNNFTIAAAENDKVTFVVAVDNGHFQVSWLGQSGVELVGAEDGEAVYYNLQGVRIQNPESGLYIVRQGNKVSKVIL